MKITYIIFLTICLSLHCFGENNNGKIASSSYSYSIEYNDSDHGNFGHKIEVKDGTAKVDIRSENPGTQKFNSVRQIKSYSPQKKPVALEKPKQELTYLPSANTGSPTITPSVKNTLSYAAPQVSVQTPKNNAYNSALQKYSHEQLSVLLSQNKNPFLPLDPKDSISQFISQFSQSNQLQQSHNGYNPQVQHNFQYQPQTYAQTPSVSAETKSHYPASFYSPSTPQQNSGTQQAYHQPQVQYSNNHLQQNIVSHYPQIQSVPQTQSAVQYMYVPQTSSPSHVAPQQTSQAQFTQQSFNTDAIKQQYVPSAAYQSNQLSYSIPKISPGQSYPTGLYNDFSSSLPQSNVQGKQQYVTTPIASKTLSTQPNYQNAYISSSGSQYPTPVVSPSQYGSATYKQAAPTQLSSGNFDFSKFSQFGSTQSSTPYISPQTTVHSPSTTHSTSGAGAYGQSLNIVGNIDLSKYSHFGSTQSPTPYISPQATVHSPSTTQYSSASTLNNAGNIDLSKYSQYGPIQSSTPYISQQAAVHSPSTAQYGQNLNTGSVPSVQDSSKSNIFGSNLNFGSLFSGDAGLKIQEAIKNSGNIQFNQISTPSYGNNLNQGQQTHPQVVNSASSTNYKPIVEHPATDTSAKIQYQPAAANSVLGSNNFDISKFQFPGFNLGNIQSNYQIPSGNNINLKPISNVQVSDNKHGQYAIDFRQGTNPTGAAQVMVHTNYNLGAQNLQSSHGSVPATAASGNSNAKYMYVPTYASSSS